MQATRLPFLILGTLAAARPHHPVVGCNPLEPADGDGLFLDTPPAASRLAGRSQTLPGFPGTHSSAGSHVSLGEAALGDQPDVSGTSVWAGQAHWQSTTLW